MRLRDLRGALHLARRRHHRSARYAELTAECSDELALIAERRRSDLSRF